MTKENDKVILLIDSHALIHRAYHALPPNIVTSKGEQVNAVYGFTKILLEVLEKFHPEYVVAAIDKGKAQVRIEKFADYKAQRKPLESELLNQIPRVYDVLKALNIPTIGVDGFEADDVIGTISEKLLQEKLKKIIVTGDQDLFQLIRDDVTVLMAGTNFSKSMLYTEKEVKAKLGFGPEFVVDFKALKGDTSDNIPGVKGIGDKTASELIRTYGHLDQIY